MVITFLNVKQCELSIAYKKQRIFSRLVWQVAIIYVENPKDSKKRLLELIHESSKFRGYKNQCKEIGCVSIYQ